MFTVTNEIKVISQSNSKLYYNVSLGYKDNTSQLFKRIQMVEEGKAIEIGSPLFSIDGNDFKRVAEAMNKLELYTMLQPEQFHIVVSRMASNLGYTLSKENIEDICIEIVENSSIYESIESTINNCMGIQDEMPDDYEEDLDFDLDSL